MKKFLFLYLFAFSIPAFSQDYKPLLDTYNEWQVTNCFFGCNTDRYWTDGDTIVDGVEYKILDGFHFISRSFLLREEVANRKVYLNFVDGNEDEYLLYNFDLNVGDTFDMKNPVSPFPEDAGMYQLDSIILRPLSDGNDYRHFYFSPTPSNTISTTNAVWVEGAGSLSLINAPSGLPDINGVGHLSCSFKNSVSFYTNLDSITSCEPFIVLDIDEVSNPLFEVNVTTLVSNDICTMTNTHNVRFIDIYDLNGRRVLETTNNGSQEINLNLSSFKSGVYIIVMNTKQFQKRTFKIVVN